MQTHVDSSGKRTLLRDNKGNIYPDGKLDLKNGYSVTKVVYHSMGDKYIPYIIGCVVRGPKGGKYMLDAFGIQHLFRYFGITTQQGVECRLLDNKRTVCVTSKCLMQDKDLASGKTNEECASNYARSHNYKYVKRSDVLTFIDKIRR